jgi:pimeloyl-ACP methyl ester carboxylesterase
MEDRPAEDNCEASLIGDFILSPGPIVLLHGAGAGESARFTPLRERLAAAGLGSIAFDFVGHGKTGGDLSHSSLAARDNQSLEVLKHFPPLQPLVLWGSSMGAYNAVMLSKSLKPKVLVLSVPAVYHPGVYHVPFGPAFTELIRRERSWEQSDAWEILANFRGHLLILAGGEDKVIPSEIPERIYNTAANSLSRQLRLYPKADHHVIRYLEQSISEFDALVMEVSSLVTTPNAL